MGQKQSVPTAESSSPSVTSTNAATATPQQSAAIAAEVDRTAQPPAADAARHTYGQPALPPHHSSASTTTEDKKGASKLVTDCRKQQRASLACIEENYQNKHEACAHLFEEYKRCRRQEHERRPAW